MKNLLLSITAVACLTFSSCSKDEDSNPHDNSVITATIDGVPYTFNTITVEEDHQPTYTDVTITGSIDNNPSRTISIVITEGLVGSEASWYFSYFLNDTAYPKTPDFATIVDISNESHMKGTFWGQVESIGEPEVEVLTITNGTFDVFY